MKQRLDKNNPWQIPPSMQRALDAVLETGSQKGAAVALNCSVRTINSLTYESRKRMQAKTLLHALLAWHEFKKETQHVAE